MATRQPALSLIISGDDADELKANLEAALEALGVGATEEEEEEEKPRKKRKPKDEEDEEEVEDEEEDEKPARRTKRKSKDEEDEEVEEETEEDEEVDEYEAQREKLTKAVRRLTREGEADKIRAAFRKVGAKVLSDVKDNKLALVAKALGVKL